MRYTRYTNEDILRSIRLLAANIGRKPVPRDYVTSSGTRFKTVSQDLLRRRFGGTKQALSAAGVDKMRYWMPQGVSRENTVLLHPLEGLLDEYLHSREIEHTHWAFTKEWIGPHQLLFPVLIKYPAKTGTLFSGVLFRPSDLEPVEQEWNEIRAMARRWMLKRFNGEVTVLYLNIVLSHIGEQLNDGIIG